MPSIGATSPARSSSSRRRTAALLSAEDLANYRSGFDEPVETSFGDIKLYACGPWCQGPSLLQAFNLLDAAELHKLGHNSIGYLHRITEAVKLAFADREAYFGDPRMVDVPIEALLSRDYARQRREMIRPDRAWPEMPPAGDPRKLAAERSTRGAALVPERAFSAPELDTSHVCVIDRHGNVFAATPSDGSYNAPVMPELGIIPSPRGSQNWGDPDHPSGVAPGKRPRLTPSPAIAIEPGKMKMPFGTPGGDVQTQAMLQVFLNIHLFGMEVQEAVEAPRVASYSFPVLVRAARLSSRPAQSGEPDRPVDRRGARPPRPQGRMVARLDVARRRRLHDRRRPGDRRAQGRCRPTPAVLCARVVTPRTALETRSRQGQP